MEALKYEEEEQRQRQHMAAPPPPASPLCRESSRRSNAVGARLRCSEPPGPAPWGRWYQHRQRTGGKRPRVALPPPTGPRGGATSPAVSAPPLPGIRARIRLKERASTARNKQDLMGVFFLWPRTPCLRCPCVCCTLLSQDSLQFMAMVSGGSRGRRVLLVEDNEINRVVVRRLMRGLDMGMEEAENGKVAVDFVRQGKSYDLILMDKEMPVMDGHEATRQLRSLGVRTPIVALSGDSLQSDRDLFLQAGADDFEAKPLSKDRFARILTKYGLHHGHTQQ